MSSIFQLLSLFPRAKKIIILIHKNTCNIKNRTSYKLSAAMIIFFVQIPSRKDSTETVFLYTPTVSCLVIHGYLLYVKYFIFKPCEEKIQLPLMCSNGKAIKSKDLNANNGSHIVLYGLWIDLRWNLAFMHLHKL